jgi:hypothetical protein
MKLRQAMDIWSSYHDDPGVSMPSRAIGLSAKTKGKKKEVKAGGPGSGRKPEGTSRRTLKEHQNLLNKNLGKRPTWQPGAKNVDNLEKNHSGLQKMGFKYNHSTGQGNGHIMHTYKDSKTTEGRAYIHERANGNHSTTFKPFR